MQNVVEISVADVVYRKDLYPRSEVSQTTVQKYAEDLSVLPPIEVDHRNVLIDGMHRWTAHKKKEVGTIRAFVTVTGAPADDPSDADKVKAAEAAADAMVLELSVERNAAHGYQLSTSDKKKIARDIYRAAKVEERGEKKRRLAQLLSMSYETVNRWLARIDKDTVEERNSTIQRLYLQCHTKAEIAERTGTPETTVSEVWSEIVKYQIPTIPGLFMDDAPEDAAPEKVKAAFEEKRQAEIEAANRDNAEHATDFAVPLYNVWKQQTKSEGSEHFGNSEVRWVDNLLYMYTKPFDVVVDPFAGGGSTLDICRKRFRRCWISDRKPIEERKDDIRELDLMTAGLPDLRKRWNEVSLVYLDPPYWLQAAGQYSQDATDLANMPLDEFNKALAGVIKGFADKMKASSRQDPAYIALIIQPTQWKAPERQFTDHVGDMLRAVKMPVEMRYSVPYESQQCTAQMVEWAKANKRCLVLSREIVVWRVA